MSNNLTLLIMLGHRRYGEGMPVTRIGRHGDFATSTERHMESFVQQRTSLIQTFVELGFRFLGGHKLPNVEEEERRCIRYYAVIYGARIQEVDEHGYVEMGRAMITAALASPETALTGDEPQDVNARTVRAICKGMNVHAARYLDSDKSPASYFGEAAELSTPVLLARLLITEHEARAVTGHPTDFLGFKPDPDRRGKDTMRSRRAVDSRLLSRIVLCAVLALPLFSLGNVSAGSCPDFLIDSFDNYVPPSSSPISDAEPAVSNRLRLAWQHSTGASVKVASAPADDASAGTYHLAAAQTALKLEVGNAGGKAWFLTPLGCRVPMAPYVGVAYTIMTTYRVNYGVSILTGNCPASVNTSVDGFLSPQAPGIAYWAPVRHGDTTFVGVNPNISERADSTMFTENVFIDLGKLYGNLTYHPRVSHVSFEGFPPNAEVWIKDVALVGSHEGNCTTAMPEGLSLFDPGPGKFHYGSSIDWTEESPLGYIARLGNKITPTLWNSYLVFGRGFPRADLLHQWASQIAEVNATEPPIFNLFAMPNEQATPDDPAVGLERVTNYALEGLAEACRQLNLRGVPVLVTLGHEPNGFWYSYGLQPANFTAFFRRAYTIVKRRAGKGTAVALSLNAANVYWSDAIEYDALLDTNLNGVLDPQDNPYSPYFPGKEFVDWIGISMYFYGVEFPWGVNEEPPATRFADALVGRYGTNGHAIYSLAEDNDLPLFVFETSAAYFTAANASGPTRAELMHGWRKQVYAPETFREMPLLRGIQWFEHRHFEEGTARDYRAAATEKEAQELVADLEEMGTIDGKNGATRIAGLGEGWWGDIRAYVNVS